MSSTLTADEYRQRADMHERLASSTGDLAARRMHLAMASEFRRKALEAETAMPIAGAQGDPIVRLVAAGR